MTTSTSTTLSATSLSGLGFSGLSSGLDTSSIVTKLMAIEAAPQTQLKTQLTTLQTHTTALQSLNTALAGIATTAHAAVGINALSSFTTTSSSDAASATASSTALAGTTRFTVDKLAQTQVSVTDSMADTGSLAGADHTITIKLDGATTGTKIVAASDSVDAMISAINAANVGVSATKITSTSGGVTQYRLQLTATSGGAAGAFSIFRGDSVAAADQMTSSSSPALTAVTTAQDAQITLYPDTAAAQPVYSSTNTFSNQISGLTLNVSATTTTPVSITVAADSSAAVTSAQALTSGLISVFSAIASSSAITSSSSTSGGSSSSATSGGVFTGDSLVRSVKDGLLTAATKQLSNGRSPSSIGINITKDGTITFDQGALSSAMAADPTGTMAMYQEIATRVSAAASDASAPYTGSVSQAITSETTRQSTESTQISDWDTRLAAIQAQYEAQFAAMETALNSLSSQASYLTSQITGLTTNYQS